MAWEDLLRRFLAFAQIISSGPEAVARRLTSQGFIIEKEQAFENTLYILRCPVSGNFIEVF